ncbi:hypothetical protein [Haloarchaeobius sp. DFWS5]|uniref:hypothetical protein n=1 Tax=Haloarchaeobius sp. DFWS5 TaxID=3446114 RepID=UPI003EBCAA7C
MRTNRRNLLRALGSAAIVGAAGCLTDSTTTPGDGSDTDGNGSGTGDGENADLDFEVHQYRATDLVVEDGLGPESTGGRYATVLSDAAATERFVSGALDDETATFVEGTDFASHELLVVQTYLDSVGKQFSLDSVTRVGAELDVQAAVKSEGMGAEQITYETVLARVPAADAATESISLSVDGESAGTFAVKAPESVDAQSVHLHHTDRLYADALDMSKSDTNAFAVKAFSAADALSLSGHAEAQAFVDETDFSSQSLVAVQTRVGSPCKSLAIRGAEQGRRLRVRAAVEEKDAVCTQQVQLSTALVRVPVTGIEDGEVSAVIETADGSERAVLAK